MLRTIRAGCSGRSDVLETCVRSMDAPDDQMLRTIKARNRVGRSFASLRMTLPDTELVYSVGRLASPKTVVLP